MTDKSDSAEVLDTLEEELMPIPKIDSVLLSATDLKDLERSYQNVHGDDMQEVSMPEMNSQPAFQRSLGPYKYVRHGKATERFVSMIGAIRNMTEGIINGWEQIYDHQASGGQSPAHSLVSSVSSSLTLLEKQSEAEVPRKKKLSKAATALQRKYAPSFSDDQSDAGRSSDDDSDLDDFVVRDTEPIYKRHPSSTRSSSPPPDFPPPKTKPFFEPTQFTATQDTNDDDDVMPDISDLLAGKITRAPRSPLMQKRVDDNLRPEKNRRGKRRRILEDEDSNE